MSIAWKWVNLCRCSSSSYCTSLGCHSAFFNRPFLFTQLLHKVLDLCFLSAQFTLHHYSTQHLVRSFSTLFCPLRLEDGPLKPPILVKSVLELSWSKASCGSNDFRSRVWNSSCHNTCLLFSSMCSDRALNVTQRLSNYLSWQVSWSLSASYSTVKVNDFTFLDSLSVFTFMTRLSSNKKCLTSSLSSSFQNQIANRYVYFFKLH